MSRNPFFIAVILIIFIADISACRKESESLSILKGPYLGQEPPGMTPVVFAPGIISTEANEGSSHFSKDGKMFLFVRAASEQEIIFIMEQKEEKWSRPEPAPFSAGRYDWDFTLAPDGNTVYVSSGRPTEPGGTPHGNYFIWESKRSAQGWSEPQLLPFPVNSSWHDSHPTITESGNLYFFSQREGGLGEADIYRSSRVDGRFAEVENLGSPINTEYGDLDPYIAPDESYLIFCSDKPGGYGKADLYVAFHNQDGSWTEPVNMGETVNTAYSEYIPSVSPDGKYFFFTTNKSGIRNIYWMDAKFIEELKSSKTYGNSNVE